MKTEWFETFFQGPAVDFWTRAMPPAQTLADADFLEKTFDVKPGARLLDVPCGNGRHSIELARRGYRVTGIDLSEEFLAAARAELDADWRKGDMRALDVEAAAFDGAFCFGNSFGYLDHAGVAEFLSALSETLQPGDALLLGTDLVKDTGRLVRAYDDSAGVTARFNRNVLAVVNRELDADFDLDAFEHVARWNAADERIEMWLRSSATQRVRIAALALTVDFAEGEEMLTEVSSKFRPDRVVAELADVGLRRTHWWTDPAGDFGLSLSVK